LRWAATRKVLVMDEPAANLDPQARKIFFELLAERAAHTTMLISSHRINEVSALVNRVVELDMGRVVLDERHRQRSQRWPACAPRRVVCRQPEPALAKALAQWNFRAARRCRHEWEGEVAGPDRLRFLGTVSRYVAVVSDVSLTEEQAMNRRVACWHARGPDAAGRRLLGGCGRLARRRLCRRHAAHQVGPRRCVRCGMAISDRRFAVQLRGGPKNEAFKFDDIGCATTWCSEKVGQHPWINDPRHALVGGRVRQQRPRWLPRARRTTPAGAALAHGLQPAPPTRSRSRQPGLREPWPNRRRRLACQLPPRRHRTLP
jgi:hypothetical protein